MGEPIIKFRLAHQIPSDTRYLDDIWESSLFFQTAIIIRMHVISIISGLQLCQELPKSALILMNAMDLHGQTMKPVLIFYNILHDPEFKAFDIHFQEDIIFTIEIFMQYIIQ